jgi:branched-chain amino acid transport system ATP-binding protein
LAVWAILADLANKRRRVLAVSNLTSRYGRVEVLHGLSLEVRKGEIVTLVGSNGAGKTTLLRTISGVQPITAGSIEFCGELIGKWRPHVRVARGIAQVPEGRQIFPPLSVDDNLRLGSITRRDGNVSADLAEMYALFPVLAEFRDRAAGNLSGGQQQMLAIGRALMARPKLLLLDEPSMGLSPVLVEQVFAIVGKLKDRGLTILLVEQNAHAALAIADRGYVIETGRIAFAGAGRDLLNDGRVRSAYLGA